MEMSAVHKLKDATSKGVRTINAARGDSQHSAELRKQLGISAGLAIIAGAVGFFAFRAMRCAGEKAAQYDSWKAKDDQLDKDLEDSLDASDAVARY